MRKQPIERPLAHSNPAHPDDPARWEPLLSSGTDTGHLDRVEHHCLRFARAAFRQMLSNEGWIQLASLAARWHDLGKFSDEFQYYLLSALGDSHRSEQSGRVDHSSAGAQHAMKTLPPPCNAIVAYVIAGHHAGLLDGLRHQGACLLKRLQNDNLPPWRDRAPENLLEATPIRQPRIEAPTRDEAAFQLGFATRMLFSCLVDADFLATEAFMDPERAAERPQGKTDFKALDDHLTDWLDRRFATARGSVSEARAAVLTACREKAAGSPGLYSLTVPTGGGKTLSSLAFALRHCARNGLERVIYAIPFTSIIEQTAEVFRGVFAEFPDDIDALILEHHSNFDPKDETTRTRLASENWAAPLVVTTNVQLFESLFANRTSRCRKLHHVANSVIILDEAQTLPVTLLAPCLRVLRLLVEQYGCTIVLCTATQPAIEYRPRDFEIGLSRATPIIDDAPTLYRRLKRVQVRDAGTLDCAELATRMTEYDQGLAIINTRRHATTLYEALKHMADDGCFHLSAAMTPEHRSQRLAEIRRRLDAGSPCRVVATQLIEAGVDVDFPVVWRALAGLDAIAQAAGRCNREGRLHEATTWIFRPAEEAHARLFGTIRTGANATGQVIESGRYSDLLGLDAIERYFHLHYWQHEQDWDRHDIGGCFRIGDQRLPLDIDFTTIAERFRFIGDTQRPVIVPWGDEGAKRIERLRGLDTAGLTPDRRLRRQLQRQTVTVGDHLWQRALNAGHLEVLCDRFAVLTTPRLHYHEELGLQLDADPLYDPTDTIV